MSERRACRTIGCLRMTVRYRCCRPDTLNCGSACERWRMSIGGSAIGVCTFFRLYREERLMVRRRGGRKRALGTRAPMLVPQWPNDRWSLDFVADQFIDGRRMRILAMPALSSSPCRLSRMLSTHRSMP